jgi:hypothetical protein
MIKLNMLWYKLLSPSFGRVGQKATSGNNENFTLRGKVCEKRRKN